MAGRSNRKSSEKLDSVVQVLQGLFENNQSPLAEGFQRYRLEQQWAEVVSQTIASYSRPVDLKGELLTIAVTNASLLTELQYFREEIITKVNSHMGQLKVRKVRFISE